MGFVSKQWRMPQITDTVGKAVVARQHRRPGARLCGEVGSDRSVSLSSQYHMRNRVMRRNPQ